MNFGKFLSVLFALVQDDCYSRLRQGDVGKRGAEGGGGWRGRILEPALRDDEKAGKPSS